MWHSKWFWIFEMEWRNCTKSDIFSRALSFAWVLAFSSGADCAEKKSRWGKSIFRLSSPKVNVSRKKPKHRCHTWYNIVARLVLRICIIYLQFKLWSLPLPLLLLLLLFGVQLLVAQNSWHTVLNGGNNMRLIVFRCLAIGIDKGWSDRL